MPQVLCYQDDILVMGKDHSNHPANLEIILKRLEENGLTVQHEKCAFIKPSLKHLGHLINAEGIHPLHDKVEAIKTAPIPTDSAQLRLFLGLINYYQKFLPNRLDVLYPLHKLLQKDVRWAWSTDCQKSFDKVKSIISTENVLFL